jgi:hypothetical protein
MEVVFRPLVPNNFEHWQVFHDDAQIIRFMNNLQEFVDYKVDWREEGGENLEMGKLRSFREINFQRTCSIRENI